MFVLNHQYDLGEKKFSETEIIEFATAYDPLTFHLNADAAHKSLFKGLVCSGPQPFNYFYRDRWVPKFGPTVVAGIGVDNWRFVKPVYVNQIVHCRVRITELTSHPEKGTVTVRWYFEFVNDEGTLVQHLEMLVLHRN